MRTLTVTLPDDIYHVLSVRAAIDDLTPADGIVNLLTVLVDEWEREKETEIKREKQRQENLRIPVE